MGVGKGSAKTKNGDGDAADRATVGRTIWMTEAQDAAIRAQMAREGRRSISDFLRALIVRGLGLAGGA